MGVNHSAPVSEPATLAADADEQIQSQEAKNVESALKDMEQIVLKQEARIYELNQEIADLRMRAAKK